MEDKQLLAEVDALLAQRPPYAQMVSFGGGGEAWLGAANAVLELELAVADKVELTSINRAIEAGNYLGLQRDDAMRALLRLIHKVRHRVAMRTGGTGTIAIDQGMHFQYFDVIKGVFESATTDLLVVDPYLDETVLSKFCQFAKPNVPLRLLGDRGMTKLQPAAAALNQQRSGVQLKRSNDLHDRYVFVDRAKCFLSGASFKDGPKYSTSILTEIVDSVPELLAMYEARWRAGTEVPI